jgi:hypothetical protein
VGEGGWVGGWVKPLGWNSDFLLTLFVCSTLFMLTNALKYTFTFEDTADINTFNLIGLQHTFLHVLQMV